MSGHLALERIEVRRTPGFRRAGFTVDGLSPGVNVVYGPNGAGKTTTARAIESILWPDDAVQPEASLFGRYLLDGARWTVDLDTTRRACQRDGLPAEPPAFPPGIARDRYRLSLTELLQADDRSFAEQIARESAGGYDVAAAAARLGFNGRVSGRQAVGDALRSARKQVDEARRVQEDLRAQELMLARLRSEQEKAAAAVGGAQALDRALELADARDAKAALTGQMKAFPEWMGRLVGDEKERLDRLREQAEAAEQARRQAEASLEEARLRLSGANLPGDGLRYEQLSAFRETLDRLRELDRTCRDAERRQAEAKAVLAAEERSLGGAVVRNRLATLALPGLQELGKHARTEAKLWGERASVEEELGRLGDETEPPDPDRLWQGMRSLSGWLRGPDPGTVSRMRRTAMTSVAVALLVGAGGFVAVGGPPVAALLALLLGLATGWGLLALLLRRAPDLRSLHRQEFERLDLAGPQVWSEEGVTARLEVLQREAVEAEAARDRKTRRSEVLQKLATLGARQAELDTERASLAARVGLPPGAGFDEWVWLVERIGSWQTAERKVREAEAALEASRRERERLLTALGAALRPFGYAEPRGVEAAVAALDDLGRRREAWEAARHAADQAQEKLEQAKNQAQRVAEERAAVFARLGLNAADLGDEAQIRRWVERLEEYRSLQSDWDFARRRVQELEPGSGESIVPWAGRPREELKQARQEVAAAAEHLEEATKEIHSIEALVEQAKKQHALEEALARYEEARDQVRALFRQEARMALGRVLASAVQELSRDSERPQVFHRARDVFARITAGRYRLELQDGEGPAFRAVESETGEGRSLEELSSGTRVQLLLAVRVAFVETQEHGVRLPLVFDEVLANSDDERARAVMDAVVALACEGRQIVYFTAQMDEVAKWRSVLRGSDVPHAFLDLAALRRGQEATRWPLPEEPALEARPVPAPGDRSYAEYGRLLQVPGIDPYASDLGHVHLWHLLDAAGDLYRVLRHGLERWGPLHTLGEPGSEALLGEDGLRIYRQAFAAARALEATLQAWRIGRGRPVDAGALAASGAVSRTFLPRVAELARQYGGDARLLVESLERGALPRFRQSSIDQLREHLEQQGYLDDLEPLAPEEVRARVLGAVAGELRQGLLTQEHVERLIRTGTGARSAVPGR
ncbi:ATP-binding protein [Limnochorda pilosa]|uniref:YhaN AAA domain-containing protein n=1 Tax=Limnochorda pilosa TaxID=1555112 RepID=A0A0K2SLA6_LIMPI|nr:AAA family ATPase [Limnochorda pilosa]BAS27885.1 hypothetical protein LIP_2044 [Limnochorda pilosa]